MDYRADGLAFDPIQHKLWIADRGHSRLLRVSDFEHFRGRLHQIRHPHVPRGIDRHRAPE